VSRAGGYSKPEEYVTRLREMAHHSGVPMTVDGRAEEVTGERSMRRLSAEGPEKATRGGVNGR
jgi:hypothetical protein